MQQLTMKKSDCYVRCLCALSCMSTGQMELAAYRAMITSEGTFYKSELVKAYPAGMTA